MTRTPLRTAGGDALDAKRAASASEALAQQWAEHYDVALADGLHEHEAMVRATSALESAVARTAETEAAQAYNDEITRLNELARASGYDVVETWVAMAEACPICIDMHGEERVSPDSFSDRPPLHPNCACTIETDIRSARAAA